jgi:hypothetical protein
LHKTQRMSGMEPEVSRYLRRIATSISAILIWMLVIILFGLKFGYLFFEEGHTLGSSIFYIWLLASGFFLVRWLVRYWRPFF